MRRNPATTCWVRLLAASLRNLVLDMFILTSAVLKQNTRLQLTFFTKYFRLRSPGMSKYSPVSLFNAHGSPFVMSLNER